ncbi:MAG: PAS domain-containing sensor histidine kinase, partial [Chthonomonadaceae bacterium]|nr:PAS domain-containing sensor histidine kinase [Chthonomonadaceae bacterium]
RLSQLIDALLGYSRLSRVAMEVRELDFSETASRIAEEIREAKAESVDVWVEPGLSIRADPELLEILLANLLSNAFKFTSRTANPRIEVGKVGDEFFVRDNGAGFDPAFSQRLFRAFERLHNEREFPGTGIGLASVERIVARHRGSVRAESAPGEGATFYFRLEGGTQGEGSGAVA